MNFHTASKVHLRVPRSALAEVFAECDGFDADETGGRLVGTFSEKRGVLEISVTGVIESGPNAKRSNVSFFQDGEYQENAFRKIERLHPETEHLGNWHTHHVNGYPTLSPGDVETYQRTVNHSNHNTTFFYAMLVTEKIGSGDSLERYKVKHYIFRRNDRLSYEVPNDCVELTDEPILWPALQNHFVISASETKAASKLSNIRPERVYDSSIVREFYPDLRTFQSTKLGIYWRGTIDLVDGSKLAAVVVEDAAGDPLNYSIAFPDPAKPLKSVTEELSTALYPSARAAAMKAERCCNNALLHWYVQNPKSLARRS